MTDLPTGPAALPDSPKPPNPVVRAIARVQRLRPIRVLISYAERRGPLLAAGLSYQALFAAFASIWVGFSIAGLIIQGDVSLQNALFGILSTSVPGLIQDESGEGVIDPAILLESTVLGWTGAIALVGLFATALGWLASGRDAVRAMFGIGAQQANLLLLKLKDLGLAVAFGAALLLSAVLSVASTAALTTVLDWAGLDEHSTPSVLLARGTGLFIVFVLDTAVLGAFYRIVSGIAIPTRRLLGGSLLGAAALGVLKALGSALLGGATSNPLLASFAVIIGLLIWFNFICQVVLIAASWIAVGMADRGIAADPRLETERLAKQEAEEDALRERILDEVTNDRRGWIGRLLRRRRP